MHVKILGSAAGGGFPQWNCACRNCRLVRSGNFPGKARSQTQLALSPDGASWFLLGASPDLRSQIEGCVELQPRDEPRISPICGVVLTSAELDQALGLLLLREFQPFSVYATDSVIRILRDNSMYSMLDRAPVHWHNIRPGQDFQLRAPGGNSVEMNCVPLTVSSRYPG